MNRLLGRIVSVESSGEISLIDIRIGSECVVSVLVIDGLEPSPYLAVGGQVGVLFKESEVVLVKGEDKHIGALNRIPARIAGIGEHALLSEINLTYEALPLRALVPSRSLRELGLKVGDDMTVLVNPTEITLAEIP